MGGKITFVIYIMNAMTPFKNNVYLIAPHPPVAP